MYSPGDKSGIDFFNQIVHEGRKLFSLISLPHYWSKDDAVSLAAVGNGGDTATLKTSFNQCNFRKNPSHPPPPPLI